MSLNARQSHRRRDQAVTPWQPLVTEVKCVFLHQLPSGCWSLLVIITMKSIVLVNHPICNLLLPLANSSSLWSPIVCMKDCQFVSNFLLSNNETSKYKSAMETEHIKVPYYLLFQMVQLLLWGQQIPASPPLCKQLASVCRQVAIFCANNIWPPAAIARWLVEQHQDQVKLCLKDAA